MKVISKLNTTTKILILVLYVLVLSLITFGVSKINFDKNVYENYGIVPGDENMGLSIRLKERRTAPTSSSEIESQYWDFQVYLHLKDQNAIYRNVTIYTAILRKNGTYKYEEKTASILTGIQNPNNISGSTSDRGIYSSYAATSKTITYDSSTEEYTIKDGTPEKIYVKVVYEIFGNNEKKSFTYQCDVINSYDVDFGKYEKTSLTDSYIDLKNNNEVLKIKLRTTLSETDNDVYRFNVEYNPLDENEINKIKDVKLALFLETTNTENDKNDYVNNYIEFVQYYGALPYLYTIPQVSTEYNSMFDASNLYVYVEINDINGRGNVNKIYIPISELPTFE